MKISSFGFEVLVNGNTVREYEHEGHTYIEAKKGSSFSLRMRNGSDRRVLFVPTVDGLSIIDGKGGSFESRGYIVGPHSSIKIDGWRSSEDNVAEFEFTDPNKSYSNKIGKGKDNVGVIGCAVFFEKVKYSFVPANSPFDIDFSKPSFGTVDFEKKHYGDSSAAEMSLSYLSTSGTMDVSSQNVGTGWGEYKESKVVSVEFDRCERPDTVFSIFYNTKEGLRKVGVLTGYVAKISPSAFPEESSFCRPPER